MCRRVWNLRTGSGWCKGIRDQLSAAPGLLGKWPGDGSGPSLLRLRIQAGRIAPPDFNHPIREYCFNPSGGENGDDFGEESLVSQDSRSGLRRGQYSDWKSLTSADCELIRWCPRHRRSLTFQARTRLLPSINLRFVSFCHFGCFGASFHAVGLGAKGCGQVERVNRRAILGKPEVAEVRMVAQQ